MKQLMRSGGVAILCLAMCLVPATVAYALWRATVAATLSVTTESRFYLKSTDTDGSVTGNVSSAAANGSTHKPLSLAAVLPGNAQLFNYDTDVDGTPGHAGLSVRADAAGLTTATGDKIQKWRIFGPQTIAGTAQLRLWSQVKDGRNDKRMKIRAALYLCNPTCVRVGLEAQKSRANWSSTNNVWVEETWFFSSINVSLSDGHWLELRVVNDSSGGNGSEDLMWFAYDTASFPSALTVTPQP